MSTMQVHSGQEAFGTSLVRDAAEIDGLAWQPVVRCPGVYEKELWRRGESVDALIRYEPGATTPGGPHHDADHHIWVVSGAITIAGRELMAGSYVYVARGVAHPIRAIGPEGCVLLQIHRTDR